MKPKLRQIPPRTWAIIIVVMALPVLIYVALQAVGTGQEIALSVSGVVLIGGVACLIIKSNEKKLGVIFICVGFSCRPLVSFILLQFGIGQFLAAAVGDLLLVVIIVTGLLVSGPIARRLLRN